MYPQGASVLLILAFCGLPFVAPAALPQHHQVPDEYVCGELEPPFGELQAVSAPYAITVSKSNVQPGGSVEVTVSSNTPADPIRGLALKAKCGENILGSFSSDLLDAEIRDCDGVENSGLLYINKNPNILEATFRWTAPSGVPCQDVRFHFTIVKDRASYWIDEMSPQPLSISSENDLSTSYTNLFGDTWLYSW